MSAPNELEEQIQQARKNWNEASERAASLALELFQPGSGYGNPDARIQDEHRLNSARFEAAERVNDFATPSVISETRDLGFIRNCTCSRKHGNCRLRAQSVQVTPNQSFKLTRYGSRRLAAPGQGANCPSAASRHLPLRSA